jgi:hypothetical protein
LVLKLQRLFPDEFTAGVLLSIRANPDITFRELFPATYENVIGFHVRMPNGEHFGSIDMPARAFLPP